MEYKPEENIEQINPEPEAADQQQEAETGFQDEQVNNQNDAADQNNLFDDTGDNEENLFDADAENTDTGYEQENAFDSMVDDDSVFNMEEQPAEQAASSESAEITDNQAENNDITTELFDEPPDETTNVTDGSVNPATDNLDPDDVDLLFGDDTDVNNTDNQGTFVVHRDDESEWTSQIQQIDTYFDDTTNLSTGIRNIFLDYLNTSSDDIFTRRDIAKYVDENKEDFETKLDFIKDRYSVDCSTGDEFKRAVDLMYVTDSTYVSRLSGYDTDEILAIGSTESNAPTFDGEEWLYEEIGSESTESLQEDTNPFSNTYTRSDLRAGSFEKILSDAEFMTACKTTIDSAIENIADIPTDNFSIDNNETTIDNLVDAINKTINPDTELNKKDLEANGMPEIYGESFNGYLEAKIAVTLYSNDEYKAIRDNHPDIFPTEADILLPEEIIEELKEKASDDEKTQLTALKQKFALETLQQAIEAPINKCKDLSLDTLSGIAESETYYPPKDADNYVRDLLTELSQEEFFDFVDYAGDILSVRAQDKAVQNINLKTTYKITESDLKTFDTNATAVLESKKDTYWNLHEDALDKIMDSDIFTDDVSTQFAGTSTNNDINTYIYNVMKDIMVKQQFESLGVEKLSDLIYQQRDFSNLTSTIDIQAAKDEAYKLCLAQCYQQRWNREDAT